MSYAHSRPLSNGFTLIELMVVVSIIAVLAALLMPAIANARRSAMNVKCQSSLRQIGFGLEAYSQDYEGFVVSLVAPESPGFNGNWHLQIMPYVDSKSSDPTTGRGGVFYGCPSWRGRRLASGSFARTSFGYGMNGYPGLPTITRSSNFRRYDPATGRGEWGLAQRFHQNQIVNPSGRLYMADGNDWHQYSLRRRGTIFTSINPDWTGVGLRHGERINILFFDLHVAATPYPAAYSAILNPLP